MQPLPPRRFGLLVVGPVSPPSRVTGPVPGPLLLLLPGPGFPGLVGGKGPLEP